MKQYKLKLIIVLLSSLISSFCDGQLKLDPVKKTKLKTNHFIKFIPDEYLFVQCGLQDRKGNMWFGTAGNGIYIYDGSGFVNFTHKNFKNFTLNNDLNHNDILCCMEDKVGNIWFGTRRGLIKYKPSKNKIESKDFSLFLIPENTIKDSSRTRLPYTFQNGENFVWSIMQDNSGTIWFGTSKGLYVHLPSKDYDSKGPMFRKALDNSKISNPKHLQLNDIGTILQDRNGIIWMTSSWNKGEGIIKFDGKTLINYTPDGLLSFRTIIERRNGDLMLLNVYHGIYLYDGKAFSNANEKFEIKSDTLISMLEDKKGNLWLGQTSDNLENGGKGGLLKFDGTTLKLYTIKDGLTHNHVFCMVPDKDDNIWFGTRNTGLCKFDGKKFTDYSK